MPSLGASHDEDWAAKNRKHRRQAASFILQGSVHTRLTIARLCLEPLRGILEMQFALASHNWGLDQRAAEAEAIAAGQSALGSRQFRVTMAAEHRIELIAFGDLGMLFSGERYWNVIVDGDTTEATQATVFKILSRQGALIRKLMVDRHTRTVF